MKVLVFNQQQDLPILVSSVKPIVKQVLEEEGCSTDELAVYFVPVEEICRLHAEFFNDPSPTDCISFPMDEKESSGYHVLGEIFISPQAAVDYILSDAQELTENVYIETTLYLVHGILHLLGYKDIEEHDVAKMRQAEARHMEQLIHKQLLLKPVIVT